MSYQEYVERVRRAIITEMERLHWENIVPREDVPTLTARRVADRLGVAPEALLPTVEWASHLLSRMYINTPQPPELVLPPEGTGPRALGVEITSSDSDKIEVG